MPHLPTHNLRAASPLARFLLTAVIGIAADLATKSLAVEHLGPVGSGKTVEFIPGWLQFEYTVNRGAVFGLGQGRKALFVTVSVAAVAFLSWLFASSAPRQRVYQIVLGMLLAGVIGNMYDRVVYGYVRDMIHALPGWSWPGAWQVPLLNYPDMPDSRVFPFIFNVADSLLCTGVFLMIVYSLFHNPQTDSEKTPQLKSESV
jgi:signal peptidase II